MVCLSGMRLWIAKILRANKIFLGLCNEILFRYEQISRYSFNLYVKITAAMMDDNAGQESPPESEHEIARIAIELTQSQVDRVIRDATDAGNMPVLLSGLTSIQETLAREPGLLDDPRISTSLMRGLLVIAALPSDGGYIRGRDLSQLLGTSPSTTHRYLTTLLVVGLVERDPSSRRYRLAK